MTKGGALTKRLVDLGVASVGLVLLAPLMAAVAIGVRRSTGSSAIFRQQRAGLGGQPFVLYKFRTMRGQPIPGREAEDDHLRLTRFGGMLRRFSVDEWPQLWNVLRGDMALIGPRPLLMDYIPLYSAAQARRYAHSLAPSR